MGRGTSPRRSRPRSGAWRRFGARHLFLSEFALVQPPLELEHTLFEPLESPPDRRGLLAGRSRRLLGLGLREKIRPALLPLPGQAREQLRELPRVEPRERRRHLAAAGEAVQPLTARLQLGYRLRAPQEEQREQCRLSGVEPQRLVEELAVLHRARTSAGREPRPPEVAEPLRGRLHLRLVVVDDRLAVRRLVAREAQRVQ